MSSRPDDVDTLILAAGMGRRMGGNIKCPKVLLPLANQPLLGYTLAVARHFSPRPVVVSGPDSSRAIREYVGGAADVVVQTGGDGTGRALATGLECTRQPFVLVLLGDVPFIECGTLERACQLLWEHDLIILAFEAGDPTGYGRLILDERNVPVRVVEERDATSEERAVRLCNSGVVLGRRDFLTRFIIQMQPSPVTHEYYLTSCVAYAYQEGKRVAWFLARESEVKGINTPTQLSMAESFMQDRLRQEALNAGVRMDDPATVYLSHDTQFGSGVRIRPFVIIDKGVVVGDDASIGPFAHIRASTRLDSGVRVGNFVEIKGSHLGQGTKVPHLSYVGDAEIGPSVNIGAGTITCNYDGVRKHKTVIEEGAFVGSNVSLVAPVRVGAQARIGAGSTIARNVAPKSLSVARSPQLEKPDHARS